MTGATLSKRRRHAHLTGWAVQDAIVEREVAGAARLRARRAPAAVSAKIGSGTLRVDLRALEGRAVAKGVSR